MYDLLRRAWVLIANASDGDWKEQGAAWQKSAAKWRDEYHAMPDPDEPTPQTSSGVVSSPSE